MKSVEDLKIELKQMLIEATDLEGYTPDEIGDEELLFGGGLSLDSIDVLEIAVHLDKKYGLKIKNDEAGQAMLKSINNMAQAVYEAQGS